MKNILLLFCISFITPFASFCQFANVSWTNVAGNINQSQFEAVYGNENGNYVFILTDSDNDISNISLIFCQSSVKKATTVSYTFKAPVKSIIGATVYDKTCTLFFEKITFENQTYKQTINSITLSENTTENNVEKEIKTFAVSNKNFLGKARFIQSPSLKKSLLFIESPFIAGAKEEITMIVFDEKNNEILNKTSRLDLDSKQSVHNYAEISDEGVIYFLKKDKEKNQLRYFIYCYNETMDTFSHKLIQLPNAYITEIKGQVTPNGEFIVGGFFASEPIHSFEGYYLFKFDQSCSQKFKTQSVFDEQTLLRFLSKKEFSKDPSLKEFYLDNILILENGKLFLESEKYIETIGEEKSDWINYKDIMLVSFDEAGKYKTTFAYQKNQSIASENHLWASYKSYPYGDSLTILQNNLIKTEGKKTPEPNLVFSIVNEQFGTKIKSQIDFNPNIETPFYFTPMTITRGYNETIVAFCDFNRKKFSFAILQLQKQK